jgi:hypothetical protein
MNNPPLGVLFVHLLQMKLRATLVNPVPSKFTENPGLSSDQLRRDVIMFCDPGMYCGEVDVREALEM